MAFSLLIHPEVKEALEKRRPVVALESTILSHGMPYPKNLETAHRVEARIRAEGAVPATVGLLGGEIRVGLDAEALEHLARGQGVAKVSRRDLPVAVVRGLDGATTVAATMIVAAAAGIEVFVTGGIGGVHREAGETFDISADLPELARTSVAVVASGAKAILDLGLTLEYLETWGVPVLGFGTDRFPAFYTRSSRFAVDCRLDSTAELAAMIRTKWKMGLEGGVLVAHPIPQEHELDAAFVDRLIDQALTDAEERAIAGKDITPFLLARLEELSAGKSLRANIELVFSNATLGARLARELCRTP